MMRSSTFGKNLLVFVMMLGIATVLTAAPTDGPPKQEDTELKNKLKWTTASEVDNFGFDIYRGESEEGPFVKMTEDPLPGAGTTDEPQSYLWEDYDIEKGKDYYYYIESISMDGVREKFSPIIKAPAK